MVKPVRKKTKIIRRKRTNRKIIGTMSFLAFFLIGLFVVSQNVLPKKTVISPIPQVVLSNSSSISPNTNESLDILSFSLKKNNISFITVSVYDKESFLVKLSSGEEIIFSAEKNLDLQTSSLQLILSRLTIEGKRFSRLDFRFEKPVITLK